MTAGPSDVTEDAEDVCALPLVRRVAAMLDQDPSRWRDGDPLPRGWHIALFTGATPQSKLRPDGVAGLGVTLPDLGLPRLMLGGKRARFLGDIAIGAPVARRSRIASVAPKEGRSGRFAIVTVEHQIHTDAATGPVLIEEQDYIMREAAEAPAPAPRDRPASRARAPIEREMVPDEALLFRYCAVTFNTHRIHYDHPYAIGREGYPSLVVNGGLPVLFLIELYKDESGREPQEVSSRNLAPLFCGRSLRLCAESSGGPWRLWAEDDTGQAAAEVSIT